MNEHLLSNRSHEMVCVEAETTRCGSPGSWNHEGAASGAERLHHVAGLLRSLLLDSSTMLTVLLEKMKESGHQRNWTEHGPFVRESTDEFAHPTAVAAGSFNDLQVTIDFSAQIPSMPEIEADVSAGSPDSEGISEYPLVNSLSQYVVCDVDARGIIEDCELKPGIEVNPVVNDSLDHMLTKRSAAASLLIHTLMIVLTAFASAYHPTGTYGRGGEAVMVRLIAEEESVPVEETPASVDSAASAPSVAKDREQAKKVEREKQPDEQSASLERQAEPARFLAKDEVTERKAIEEEKKKEARENPRESRSGDGQVNSIASLPSVASEERRLLSAGGSDMEAFQSRILAAIREAIYFPKEALSAKKHGETVVKFTLNRDGSVAHLHVVHESGSPILDEAALAIVRKASKNFPSIPDHQTANALSYVVPILFKEKRSQARNHSTYQ